MKVDYSFVVMILGGIMVATKFMPTNVFTLIIGMAAFIAAMFLILKEFKNIKGLIKRDRLSDK